MKKCALCAGKLTPGQKTQLYEWKDKLIIIKNIPALVCRDCDEGYFSIDTTLGLDVLLKKIKAFSPQTAIIDYTQDLRPVKRQISTA